MKKTINIFIMIMLIMIISGCSNNKKDIICTISQSSNGKYEGMTKITTTFENDSIIFTKINIEKKYLNEYKADEDSWTISTKEDIDKNLKEGMTGDILIKDNTVYLTVNYDIKKNPQLLEIVTSHTTYDDYLNNMKHNGYECITK